MNADDFQLRRFESRLIEDRLAQIVRAECAILAELHCPTDPVAIYAILNGEQAAPWPTRTAPRDKQRALHAMHALLWVGRTRSHIAHDNARLAADAALTVGALAGDAALNAARGGRILAKAQDGGHIRGAQITEKAEAEDATIKKHHRVWEMSDEVQDQYGYNSSAKYVRVKTQLPPRTVQRRLKKLFPAKKTRQ